VTTLAFQTILKMALDFMRQYKECPIMIDKVSTPIMEELAKRLKCLIEDMIQIQASFLNEIDRRRM